MRERVLRLAAAVGEVDGAGVPDAAGQVVVQRRNQRDRAPVPRENGARRVDVEHAGAGAGVAHRQGAVEGQHRAVGRGRRSPTAGSG